MSDSDDIRHSIPIERKQPIYKFFLSPREQRLVNETRITDHPLTLLVVLEQQTKLPSQRQPAISHSSQYRPVP